jgi:hypothetical protein
MKRDFAFCLSLLCAAMVAACESSTDVVPVAQFAANLNGANEKPNPVTTAATGVFAAQIHPVNKTLSYSLSWTGLSGSITGAHIHGPSDANGVAGILVNFQALPAGSTNGTITTGAAGAASGNVDLKLAVTATVSGDSLRKLFDAGQLYVNVHTAANPGGEIRGQIVKP